MDVCQNFLIFLLSDLGHHRKSVLCVEIQIWTFYFFLTKDHVGIPKLPPQQKKLGIFILKNKMPVIVRLFGIVIKLYDDGTIQTFGHQNFSQYPNYHSSTCRKRLGRRNGQTQRLRKTAKIGKRSAFA